MSNLARTENLARPVSSHIRGTEEVMGSSVTELGGSLNGCLSIYAVNWIGLCDLSLNTYHFYTFRPIFSLILAGFLPKFERKSWYQGASGVAHTRSYPYCKSHLPNQGYIEIGKEKKIPTRKERGGVAGPARPRIGGLERPFTGARVFYHRALYSYPSNPRG